MSRVKLFLWKFRPDVVERIVGLREGIPRKDAKEVCLFQHSHSLPLSYKHS